MKFPTLTRTLALAALTVGLATPALACPGGRGGGPGERGARFAQKAEALGVDAATVEQIKTIRQEARASHEASREDMRAAKQSMKAAMEAGDEAGALAAARALHALKGQQMEARIQTGLRIRALLTPEQWKALHADRGGKRGKWGHRGKRGKFRKGGQGGFDGPPAGDGPADL
ncbi:MAG: periplasmic heavy metal sensor [Myxococcales bacterium]|nr:periplasmic heavy metal sensor [Myxococcales bacterium]